MKRALENFKAVLDLRVNHGDTSDAQIKKSSVLSITQRWISLSWINRVIGRTPLFRPNSGA